MTPAAKTIIRDVAREHGVSFEDIMGPSRNRNCVRPRKAAMSRIRAELGYSYPQIGRLFNRDHSTVMWATRGGRLRGEMTIEDRRRQLAEDAAARGHAMGVRWRGTIGKWVAHIGVDGRNIYLGCFDDHEAAATKRREAEAQYWGAHGAVHAQSGGVHA